MDELLVQYGGESQQGGRAKPWWVLQDGGGDVAAVCETPLPGAQAVVAGQWTYDAYGSCLTAEVLRAFPPLHCGHKALFFDRLDVGVVASSGDEIARLVPYGHAVYQVRNRAYAPGLGRFYQRDPNATAMALIEVTAYHGQIAGATIGALSLKGLYGDGASLSQYLGSTPWLRHDPMGLTWMDAMSAPTAMGVWNFAKEKICQVLVEHYAKMLLASEFAAALAMGDSNPGGSLVATEVLETAQAMRQFAGGRMTGNLLEEFTNCNFRTNSLRLWGMEGNLFSSILKAHHIIPQADEVLQFMNRLGLGDMVHNPLFSTLVTQAEHDIIHAGAGRGGWYNRMWARFLGDLERRGVHGNDAANAIVDFIGNDVLPRVRDALQRGGPPLP